MNMKWDKRFMNIAKEVSTWSKDPSTSIGAVCVKDKLIISTGYNGFPSSIADDSRLLDRETKYLYVVHAELNCILNAVKNGITGVSGSTLYVYGLPPCCDCTKAIIQSGISRVVYSSEEIPEKWQESFKHSMNMFNEAKIAVDKI